MPHGNTSMPLRTAQQFLIEHKLPCWMLYAFLSYTYRALKEMKSADARIIWAPFVSVGKGMGRKGGVCYTHVTIFILLP